MDTQFIPIPNWTPWENQGGAIATHDLDNSGQLDLITCQIDNPLGQNRALYRIGRNLNAAGAVTGGWGDWIAVPDWFSEDNQGVDLAIADLNNSGRPDLILFQIDSPFGENGGYYRIGRDLDANGQVSGWGGWMAVPDWGSWENQGGGIAIADISGNGRPDLLVFQVDNPQGANRGLYRIGWNLDATGAVTGGWTPWMPVPDWFFWENQGASIALADLDFDGRQELIVFQIDNPPGANGGSYQIGWQLDPQTGRVTQGWSNWTAIPNWGFWENQGAGIALADLDRSGHPKLVVFAIDNPPQQNQGFYRILDLTLDIDRAMAQGVWRLCPEDSRSLAMHAALFHTNQICFFSGSSNNPNNLGNPFRSSVWNYETGVVTAPFTPTDFFCAGHAWLPDGRLLVAGGTKDYDFGHPFHGLRDTYLFDPAPQTWQAAPFMAGGRWYPTLVELGDGRVLAASGLGEDGLLNLEPEIYTDGAGWTKLPATTTWQTTGDIGTGRIPLYAHLFLLEDGRLFYAGGQYGGNEGLNPCLLDLQAKSLTAVNGLEDHEEKAHRNQSASVMLPPVQDQKVMLMGGGAPGGGHHQVLEAIDGVNIVNLKAAQPLYQKAAPLHTARMHLNAVVLPDRTVLVTGGSRADESRALATLTAELYQPKTNTWTVMAEARVPRLYHSVALLLPDGRVITAGSNPARGDEEYRLEVYSPPYLFKGDRPVIQAAPATITYGATLEIQTPNAANIEWVNLIKAGVSTHSTDPEQRLIDLPFALSSAGQLKASVVNNPNLLPPGWYMLSIVDRRGIPSKASWIQVKP